MLMGTRVTYYLDDLTGQLINQLAAESGKSKSLIMREAVQEYAALRGYRLVPAHIEKVTDDVRV